MAAPTGATQSGSSPVATTGSDGLSGGALSGIVILCVGAVAAGVAAVLHKTRVRAAAVTAAGSSGATVDMQANPLHANPTAVPAPEEC